MDDSLIRVDNIQLSPFGRLIVLEEEAHQAIRYREGVAETEHALGTPQALTGEGPKASHRLILEEPDLVADRRHDACGLVRDRSLTEPLDSSRRTPIERLNVVDRFPVK